MNNKTKLIVLKGIMIALVCITTMVIQIPIPMTEGYVNIGDSIIFVASILFGPIPGMIAGGLGSALADILTGYSHWALFTLLIKGFEGYVVGIIVSGYLLAGTFLQGSFIISLGSVPSNTIQGIVSMVIGIPIASYLLTVKYVKSFKQISSN